MVHRRVDLFRAGDAGGFDRRADDTISAQNLGLAAVIRLREK